MFSIYSSNAQSRNGSEKPQKHDLKLSRPELEEAHEDLFRHKKTSSFRLPSAKLFISVIILYVLSRIWKHACFTSFEIMDYTNEKPLELPDSKSSEFAESNQVQPVANRAWVFSSWFILR